MINLVVIKLAQTPPARSREQPKTSSRRAVMSDLVIRQVRSSNRASRRQLDTLRSLRLGRIGREVRMSESPQLRGMIRVVDHLVEVSGEDGESK